MGRRRTVPNVVCEQCGVSFYRRSQTGRGARFCSIECGTLYHHGGKLVPRDSGALELAQKELSSAIADARAAMRTSTLYRVWPPSTWD